MPYVFRLVWFGGILKVGLFFSCPCRKICHPILHRTQLSHSHINYKPDFSSGTSTGLIFICNIMHSKLWCYLVSEIISLAEMHYWVCTFFLNISNKSTLVDISQCITIPKAWESDWHRNILCINRDQRLRSTEMWKLALRKIKICMHPTMTKYYYILDRSVLRGNSVNSVPGSWIVTARMLRSTTCCFINGLFPVSIRKKGIFAQGSIYHNDLNQWTRVNFWVDRGLDEIPVPICDWHGWVFRDNRFRIPA